LNDLDDDEEVEVLHPSESLANEEKIRFDVGAKSIRFFDAHYLPPFTSKVALIE
jgi:hypothetical protein